MHVRPEWDHVLVQRSAQERVRTQLVGLAEPNVLGEEVVTGREVAVLLIGAVAVSHLGVANARGQIGGTVLHSLLDAGCVDLQLDVTDLQVDKLLEPAECGVVFGDLLVAVVRDPDIDLDWQHDGGEVE